MAENQLTIPKRIRPGFAEFVRLSDQQMGELVGALISGAPAADLDELSEKLSKRLGLDTDDMTSVLEMLAGIQSALTFFDTPSDKFVALVVNAAESEESIRFPVERRDKIQSALREIVENSRAIRVASKASELRGETQRRLCVGNCRVVSDIRPIFSSDVEETPDAAMLVHTLKIAYHEHSGEDVLEFYVTMTGEDVRMLQDVLQRAILKERSLRGWLAATSTPFLAVEE